ncbi:MAG: sigma-70 family RNA polymerase sigma factor [Cytophagales bacterium]|nr:sigma-70 family RNA polymerase sigma factor [Cytophagales bacterium]
MSLPGKKIDPHLSDATGTPGVPSETGIEDSLLWNQFKHGSRSAATAIYERYVHILFKYGYQIVPDRNIVKDCIQDLFCELMKAGTNLSDTTSIKFYLLKALRYKLIKAKNKNTPVALDSETQLLKGFVIEMSHEQFLIGQQVDREKKNLIEQNLNKLPVLQREGLLLYFFEGMKYKEIAEVLGIKVKSARALIYRGIHSLELLLRGK